MSGVKLTEKCNAYYQEVQKGKKHRYLIFIIKDGFIDLEKVGDRAKGYKDFLEDLQQMDGDKEDCRYGLYDYEYQYNPDGAQPTNKNKMFLMSWCPDGAKIKKKMIYSSSFETLSKSFVGVHKVIQANQQDECTQEVVEEILRATDRK